MSRPNTEWKVLPHGRLTEIDDGILAVVGQISMPLVELPRRMTVVRLRDGRLIVWSAVALDEESMHQLERFGQPAFLVVPSDHHRMDAAAWKARYPGMQVVTPAGSKEKTNDVVPVDTCTPDFQDPDVRFIAVPGTREEEGALIIRRATGTTVVLNDVIGNIRHATGFGGWLLERMGLAGDEAQVPKTVALLVVKDKDALSRQLLEWADLPDLRRVIVSHGDIMEDNPGQALRDLVTRLK